MLHGDLRDVPYTPELTFAPKWAQLNNPPKRRDSVSLVENCVMSDHQLRFKGPGFDFDAKGWMGILAAIAIVAMVLWLWR